MNIQQIIKIIEICALIVVLVLVIIIYVRVQNEGFDNCFGVQYNGLNLLENKDNKICSEGTTEPLYKDGGCAVYDPAKIETEYEEGKFTKGV